MKKILFACCLLLSAGVVLAQSVNIQSGTTVVNTGALHVVLAGSSFVNDGTYTDAAGTLDVVGGTTFSGAGTTGVYNLTVNNTGSTLLNSLLSVNNTATLTAGSLNANNNLYVRSDLYPATANMVVTDVLTNNVQGLVVKATATTGGCPSYTSTLSLNISGAAMRYQWQSSPNNLTWTDVTGATNATYTATVTTSVYYRCNLTTSNSAYAQSTPSKQLLSSNTLTGTTTQTNVLCNGGSNASATITVGGGTGLKSYSWAPSGGTAATATGLVAGTYTCTVTDANACAITRTVTVTQPAAISGSISQTDVSCNGGSNGTASVSMSGGTGSLNYWWAPSGGTAASATGLVAGTYTCTVTDANACSAKRTVTVTQPAAITGTTSQTNVSCNGGSNGTATVSMSGGTAPMSYSWAPSGGTAATATGLSVGIHTCTVTDANACSVTKTVTVTQPAAINGSISQASVSCNGGSNGIAFISTSGGAAPMSFSWAPSGGTGTMATGLAAGTYTCTVTDANSCSITRTVTVTQPAAISGSISQTNVSCNGGSNGTATVSMSGGEAPLSYSWAPSGGTAASATGLVAGTYTCTVTDANTCSVTKTVTVTQPAAITGTTSQTNIACNGGSTGSAGVTMSGGTGTLTYSWAPSGGTSASATGLAAGTYTCTITDANTCSVTRTFAITQPAAMTASVSSQTNVSCNGGSNGSATITVSGGTGTKSYSWAPSGGTAATATGLAAGTYTCTITDANSCVLTKTVTIAQPTAITGTVSQTSVSCNGGSNGSASVAMSGGTGPLSYSWSPSGGTAASATGLVAGTYTCTVTDANACSVSRTVTVTQPAAITGSTSQTNVSCNGGNNGSASVNMSGGTGTLTYSWAPSGGTSASATGLVAGTYTCTVTDDNACSTTKTVTVTQPTAITGTTFQTNVSCNGGSNGIAVASMSGGTGTLSYSWAPSGGTSASATGLVAGTYTCTVTDDNACSTTKTVTVTEPTAITGTTSQTNVSCNGGSNGSASVAMSGGTGALTYSWAPNGGTAATATGLAAGVYTCTIIDGNLCMVTKVVHVTEPTAIDGATSKTDVACNGGNDGVASVSMSGGTGSLSYSWAPVGGSSATASGLAAASYTCTITDANSCVATRTVVVTEPTEVVSSVSAQTNASCYGGNDGSATVAVSGGTPGYLYSWAPAGGTAAVASGLFAGVYTVTVTDAHACVHDQLVTITQPALVTASITGNAHICNSTDTFVIINSVPGATAGYTINGGSMLFATMDANGADTIASAILTSAASYDLVNVSLGGCTYSSAGNATINIYPIPDVTPIAGQAICNGSSSTLVSLTGSVPGTTFSWVNSDPSIGLDTVGTDNVPVYTASNTTVDPVLATVTITPVANGCVGTLSSFVYTVNPTPVLTSTLTPAAICDSTLFSYVHNSATTGTVFTWSRAAVAGISNLPSNGLGNINEILENTSSAPVSVVYVDTLKANGCLNTQNVTVVVNPLPKLVSTLSPSAICDSSIFSYTPSGNVAGSTFAWIRPAVAGIALPAGSGAASIAEQLINTTAADVTTNYIYTPEANGCSGHQFSVAAKVRPTPKLSSQLTDSICSGISFGYTPASATTGTTFAWSRAAVADISNPAATGTGSVSETLINTGTSAVYPVYTYTMNYTGCTFKQYVAVKVNPSLDAPVISTMSPNAVCSNVMYQNFGAATLPPAGVKYSWSADNAQVWASGASRQYSLVNFTTPGTAIITLTAQSTATACYSQASYTVDVSSNVAEYPQVVYSEGQFICMQNNEESYQWGYDDAVTLDSTLLAGEINQNYINPTPDAGKYYWVIVSHNGCSQKAYMNVPTGVTNVNSSAVKVNLYPNPASEVLNVYVEGVSGGDMRVEVVTLMGQRIVSMPLSGNRAQLAISELSAGTYIVNCYRDGSKIQSSKIIKN